MNSAILPLICRLGVLTLRLLGLLSLLSLLSLLLHLLLQLLSLLSGRTSANRGRDHEDMANAIMLFNALVRMSPSQCAFRHRPPSLLTLDRKYKTKGRSFYIENRREIKSLAGSVEIWPGLFQCAGH